MASEKGTLLIVDDNRNNIDMCKIYLEIEGYTVHFAEDGKQGLKLTKEIMPDLILLDIMMPVMNGYQMLEVLRRDSFSSDIPVLVVTVNKDTHDVVKAFQMGANDYLKKPFDVDEFIARVNTLVKLKKTMESLKRAAENLNQNKKTSNPFFDNGLVEQQPFSPKKAGAR